MKLYSKEEALKLIQSRISAYNDDENLDDSDG